MRLSRHTATLRATACVWLLALSAPAASAAAGSAPYAWDGINRIVAVGDVHGAYTELVRVLEAAEVIDNERHWRAGTAHLVSVGDLLDRGAASRQVLDLLMRLETEAAAAGGRVHVVLGNHELMNLTGQLEYVSPGEFASYRDLEHAAQRHEAFERLRDNGRYAGLDADAARAKFESEFPPGYFGHRAAFAPDGRYGRWLLGRPLLVRLNGTLYVHGGLPPMLGTSSLPAVNDTLRADIDTYVRVLSSLVGIGLVDVDTPFERRPALARERLARRTAAADATDWARTIADLERAGASPVHDPRGPLWYRGTALCNPLYETDIARAALSALEAQGVVMGHTVAPLRRVTQRFDGLALMLDTGMLTRVYAGRPAALIVQRSGRMAVYSLREGVEIGAPVAEPRRVGARPDPFVDDAALERFLAEAPVTNAVGGPAEAPGARVLTLERDATRVEALFQPMTGAATRHELAAYALDQLLGLGMIPATMTREHGGRRGVVRYRLPRAETLAELEKRGARAGGWCPLEPQYTLVAAFDALIGNAGRRRSHLWLDPEEGLLRITDHAEAFSSSRRLPSQWRKRELPGELVRRLSALDRQTLDRALGRWLEPREIEALLARRDAMLQDAGRRSAAREKHDRERHMDARK